MSHLIGSTTSLVSDSFIAHKAVSSKNELDSDWAARQSFIPCSLQASERYDLLAEWLSRFDISEYFSNWASKFKASLLAPKPDMPFALAVDVNSEVTPFIEVSAETKDYIASKTSQLEVQLDGLLMQMAEGARSATALEKLRDTTLEQADFKPEANVLIELHRAHHKIFLIQTDVAAAQSRYRSLTEPPIKEALAALDGITLPPRILSTESLSSQSSSSVATLSTSTADESRSSALVVTPTPPRPTSRPRSAINLHAKTQAANPAPQPPIPQRRPSHDVQSQSELSDSEWDVAQTTETKEPSSSSSSTAPSARPRRPDPPLFAVSIFPFEPTSDEDLPLESGDIITKVQQTGDEWWSGTCRDRQGTFPASYVRLASGPTSKLVRSRPF
eukprot:m.725518 g.725518  ORF g.725518 m.725518 type:complete len:388 (+) comp58848_c0_seq16:831-1994(+)